MKALIWIIILILIGWGIWYFVRDNDAGTETTSAPVEQVQASDDVDLGEFQDKG